jgi:hypothetical protein
MRKLTEEHKAALAAGRKRRSEEIAERNEQLREQFSAWSLQHAHVWEQWRMHCGRAQHDCRYCVEFRRVTSAIPDMGGVDGEREVA